MEAPESLPPQDSVYDPLTPEEKEHIGSTLKEYPIWRGGTVSLVKYPVNETMAMMRKPFQNQRHFLNPAPIINGRVAVPAPPRCYPLSTAREMQGVHIPTLISRNALYNFEAPIPTPTTLRAPGGVVYRDATGDIFRHHSPCQRVGCDNLAVAAAELWGT